jgi:hypothetical protein
MPRSRVIGVAVVALVLIGMTPFRCQSGAAVSVTNSPSSAGSVTLNKFVGQWTSQIKTSNGQVFDDGVLDISDTSEPSEEEVRVLHSTRGGPVIGYTMSYPDRIEIQIPLSDGRVAHYNGVLVSPTKIRGRFFVTQNAQSHHARRLSNTRSLARPTFDPNDGEFTAQAGGG